MIIESYVFVNDTIYQFLNSNLDIIDTYFLPDAYLSEPAAGGASGSFISEDSRTHGRYISNKELLNMGFASVAAWEAQFNTDKGVASASVQANISRTIVFIKTASDFGVIDSSKVYLIDGSIDMGTTSIEIPSGGIKITGLGFTSSRLYSTEDNFTLFTSAVGGSGDIAIDGIAIEITGSNSKVYDLVGDTGNEFIQWVEVNYLDCTSLGEIDTYRQALDRGGFRGGGTPNLILSGTWVGGFRITTSLVRGLNAGFTGAIFEEGTAFVMESRFLTDMNCDLPASASLCDFQPSNFTNPSTFQIKGAIISRDGVIDPTDSNILPNITPSDLASDWVDNIGMENTFIGGGITLSAEAVTVITIIGTFVTMAGTFTAGSLQHFDSPSTGQLRHLGISPRDFRVTGRLTVGGTAGDSVTVRLRKWDDSASAFTTVGEQTNEILSLVGPSDIAYFAATMHLTMDQNDYVFFEVTNNSTTNNLTLMLDSFALIEQR